MKKMLLLTTMFLFLFACYANAQTERSRAPNIRFQEEDGSPSGRFRYIKVSNGSLTDNGDGSASLTTSGGVASIASTDLTDYDPNRYLAPLELTSVGNLTVEGSLSVTNTMKIGTGYVTGGYNPQLFLPMVATRNILIDGRTNARQIDTGVMRFLHTPAIPNTRSITFDTNSNGFDNTHAVVVDFVADGTTAGGSHDAFQLNLDTGTATGGQMNAYTVVKAGAGTLDVNALNVFPDVDVIAQDAAEFGNVGYGETTAGGDVTTQFNSAASDVTLFASDSDVVVVGHTSLFSNIEFNLATFSSKNLNLTWEYSTGVGTWASFAPTDETASMQQSGIVRWFLDDIPSWATGAGSQYLVRATRNRPGNLTEPVEDTIQVATITSYGWDKDAMLTTNGVTANDMTVSNNVSIANKLNIAGDLSTNQSLTVSHGTIFINSIPTSDPGVSGAIWSDAGTLKISA